MENKAKKKLSKSTIKKLLIALIVISICIGTSYLMVKQNKQRKIDQMTLNSLESKLQADKEEIERLTSVGDENGKNYEAYIESKAHEQGYGNLDETVYYNEEFH